MTYPSDPTTQPSKKIFLEQCVRPEEYPRNEANSVNLTVLDDCTEQLELNLWNFNNAWKNNLLKVVECLKFIKINLSQIADFVDDAKKASRNPEWLISEEPEIETECRNRKGIVRDFNGIAIHFSSYPNGITARPQLEAFVTQFENIVLLAEQCGQARAFWQAIKSEGCIEYRTGEALEITLRLYQQYLENRDACFNENDARQEFHQKVLAQRKKEEKRRASKSSSRNTSRSSHSPSSTSTSRSSVEKTDALEQQGTNPPPTIPQSQPRAITIKKDLPAHKPQMSQRSTPSKPSLRTAAFLAMGYTASALILASAVTVLALGLISAGPLPILGLLLLGSVCVGGLSLLHRYHRQHTAQQSSKMVSDSDTVSFSPVSAALSCLGRGESSQQRRSQEFKEESTAGASSSIFSSSPITPPEHACTPDSGFSPGQ